MAMLCGVIFMALAAVLACYFHVGAAANGRVHDSIESVPAQNKVLLLGTKKLVDGGRQNLYFKYRIEAAAALYRAGKIERILISGAKRPPDYDEPADMAAALEEKGVPRAVMTLDGEGHRTIDSIIHCKNEFGNGKILIVSQQFHNARALYLAKHAGLDAVALNARDVRRLFQVKMRLREAAARTRAIFEVWTGGLAHGTVPVGKP